MIENVIPIGVASCNWFLSTHHTVHSRVHELDQRVIVLNSVLLSNMSLSLRSSRLP